MESCKAAWFPYAKLTQRASDPALPVGKRREKAKLSYQFDIAEKR